MKIFSYGNKLVKYSDRNIYVEPVDNLHDLTDYEERLDKEAMPWAVYVAISRTSKGKYTTKFVLIAEDWT